MPNHRQQLRAAEKTRDDLRHRVIAHGKAKQRAPRLRKAYERWKVEVARLTRIVRRERALASGPGKAIAEARRFVGKYESAGPNRAPWLDPLEREFGFLGAPYCGIGVGHCLRAAGVQGITSRVAAVAYIEDDSHAGRDGFVNLVGHTEGRPGDALGLFGRGVHVELIVSRHSWGYSTIGFNTSPEGGSGSQSNGGGVYLRKRPFSVVHFVARPHWR